MTHVSNGFLRALVLGVALLVAPIARSADDDVDRLAVAARLVADGLWDRAGTVLSEVVEPDDPPRFHTLRGIVRLQLGDAAGAAEDLQAALALGATDPLIGLHLGQARLALGDPAGALDAVAVAGEAGEAVAGSWLLRARAHLALDDADRAWAAVDEGLARFPDHPGLTEQRVQLLVTLGMLRQAAEDGPALLASVDADARAWAALGDALRREGATSGAAMVLEEARLRFDDDVDVRVALARTCLDASLPRCAGTVLEEAALLDPRYLPEAAECFRRAGDLSRALYLNGQVADPATKLRQRLGLLLEQEAFARAASLHDRADRLGLLAEEQVAYALAYAHFRTDDHDRAEPLLRGISDPSLFRQATALREAMARCAEEGGC